MKLGMDMVVATLGCLVGLMENGLRNLSKASFVVLDKAYQVLELRFEPYVQSKGCVQTLESLG